MQEAQNNQQRADDWWWLASVIVLLIALLVNSAFCTLALNDKEENSGEDESAELAEEDMPAETEAVRPPGERREQASFTPTPTINLPQSLQDAYPPGHPTGMPPIHIQLASNLSRNANTVFCEPSTIDYTNQQATLSCRVATGRANEQQATELRNIAHQLLPDFNLTFILNDGTITATLVWDNDNRNWQLVGS
jgi:hypothetical protein